MMGTEKLYGNCYECGKELKRKPKHQLDEKRKFCKQKCFWNYLDRNVVMRVEHDGKCSTDRL